MLFGYTDNLWHTNTQLVITCPNIRYVNEHVFGLSSRWQVEMSTFMVHQNSFGNASLEGDSSSRKAAGIVVLRDIEMYV